MIQENFVKNIRAIKSIQLQTDFAVIGGGLSGVCAAISAARSGLKVVLVQDRPVLGGNASSEVRLWSLGATSHMGNNNRWSREGGLINEILLDNLKRNKEGNPLILDTVLLEKVYEEKNITLLLNTAVYEVSKKNDAEIKGIVGFCSQNSTTYSIEAPLFCDASGDGIVGFMAGASFRMGAENGSEFDEGFAPNIEDYGNLLGHSLYFYTKEMKQPISYIPPSFAIKNAEELPRIKNYQLGDHGCRLWWVEYGGRLDTIHESENIKFELWKVVYGIWDYIKNSGKYPEAANLTLEWVGTIPGKRESRRFEGDFMLSQKDIVQQRDYYDAVAHGGWAMDLHPADGIYSKHSSCTQWHSKGVYQIPYRCFYSKDIKNLFLAGRIISASHVAFGSTRVMLTCALGAQAVGEAAALCFKNNWKPSDVSENENIKLLQLELNRKGQSIPRISIADKSDLTKIATLKVSSTLQFNGFNLSENWQILTFSTSQLLPLEAKTNYEFNFEVEALEDTSLEIQLRIALEKRSFTPEKILNTHEYQLKKGIHKITFKSDIALDEKQYAFVCLMKNEQIKVRISDERCSAIMTVQNRINKAVSNYGKQEPPKHVAIDSFEFWTPERRPNGKNLAFSVSPFLSIFEKENIVNPEIRPNPKGETNVWIASKEDENPNIQFSWNQVISFNTIKLFFDCDYDHALESTLMGHSEETIPFVVSNYSIEDDKGKLLKKVENNYQAINEIKFEKEIESKSLTFKFSRNQQNIPVSVFKISLF
ncbi:MAG: FAD-dependent oxidoreductase [Flavobacteriia bacterium]|nr:FAD-dependent oxidoreductase [Flavobacteriia bacterium]OIP48679.1 MAG: FAD-binding dehydrogenase [Flavobacteriaceae bacterium CG2_30_31_66]PIV95549.1 MAG: FAD-binding dehydrogenase [Flavobacteriaceae bacterium CG17_big_fil_post_rev_8_21_14_2_50_31_13]PIX12754.1 MAG: FAD-binding dehydrogenase [Flavobacteriaceae bacterium CG_4_8_14_3_um_filter_31_8]PIY15731.1 MAG: FAD-binding dehydrogenase [Flavobacteriaceae bacterium CG_4_10_14_3_um_filter_31_253]PIZ12050.1 MAG: FAD-binding dehydrogenase [Fl